MLDAPTFETLGTTQLVGIHRSMTFADAAMAELWQAFRPRVGEIRNRGSADFISMRRFLEPVGAAPSPTARFEQWAAVEVTEVAAVPDGMTSHTMAGGTYAVFTYRGRAAEFGSAARHIYGLWLPGSGYELAEREFFEVLGPAYRPDDPEASERIWIPIRAAAV